MEEKNSTNQTNVTKPKESNVTKPKQEKKGNDKDTFADYKAEFKKIVWPGRPEIAKKTVTVIVTSLIVAGIIFCMDTVLSTGYSTMISLIG